MSKMLKNFPDLKIIQFPKKTFQIHLIFINMWIFVDCRQKKNNFVKNKFHVLDVFYATNNHFQRFVEFEKPFLILQKPS